MNRNLPIAAKTCSKLFSQVLDKVNKKLGIRDKMEKTLAILTLFYAVSFAQQEDTFTDLRDGKTYRTVKIGEQVWMAQNLENEGNEDFNWKIAMNACPEGWHLPNVDEWKTLISTVGDEAAKKLKLKNGWEKWSCESTELDDRGRPTKISKCNTNEFNFSALPCDENNKTCSWWTATAYNAKNAYAASMKHDDVNLSYTYGNKEYVLPIRCLKGEKNYDNLEMITAKSSKSKFTAYNLTKDKNFAKEVDKVLKNAAGLQKTEDNHDCKGFNDCYAEGGSSGIGDMLGGLMGGGIGTRAKGSIKAPSAGDIDIEDGSSRSKAEIIAVINARMPGLRNAYNKYLKLKPGFSGKVILKFTIAPSGDVTSISIVSSTTDYNDFDNAVKNIVGTWKWKAIKSGNTTPTIPFNFTE